MAASGNTQTPGTDKAEKPAKETKAQKKQREQLAADPDLKPDVVDKGRAEIKDSQNTGFRQRSSEKQRNEDGTEDRKWAAATRDRWPDDNLAELQAEQKEIEQNLADQE